SSPPSPRGRRSDGGWAEPCFERLQPQTSASSSVRAPAVTSGTPTVPALPAIPLPGAALGAGDPQHLLNGGHAFPDLAQSVFANARTQFARVAQHVLLGGAGMNHAAQGVVEQHQFVDAGTPAIAQLTAAVTALGVVQRRRLAGVDAKQRAFGGIGDIGALAVIAKHPH